MDLSAHLADAYLEQGYSVRVLDNLDPTVHGSSNKAPTYLSKDVEFIRGDIRDTDTSCYPQRRFDCISSCCCQRGSINV